ncbi:MAG: YegS/Rv2252/BmrU family lipid kinase [Firmicutes bacterium]|nr:YegS/Rv2252/BmrU family lipid kinase [Bacillota bacterium]
MKKCVIIFNPNSGKKLDKSFLEEYVKTLANSGYETSIYFTRYHGHASEIVYELDSADLVISIGGDGTFNEVMIGNLQREDRLLLAHIPVGTTNDLGAMFGYNKNIINNLNLALNGEVKGIDICTINNKPFVYSAGFGKFMNVPYETPRKNKKMLGRMAYFFHAVKNFISSTPLYELTYKVNDKTYKGKYSFMLISNADSIAGFNNFHKDVKLDDNQFEILFCKLTKKKDILRSLYHITAGNITSMEGFEFHRASELKIIFKDYPKNAWCIDGEKLEETTKFYDIETINDVKILLPKKNINKLFIKK